MKSDGFRCKTTERMIVHSYLSVLMMWWCVCQTPARGGARHGVTVDCHPGRVAKLLMNKRTDGHTVVHLYLSVLMMWWCVCQTPARGGARHGVAVDRHPSRVSWRRACALRPQGPDGESSARSLAVHPRQLTRCQVGKRSSIACFCY